jgi:ubiquinone/menaquinone biosynthesis C-methylase UbiE
MAARNASVTGYDRLAKYYRLLETSLFGNRLQQSRVALLSHLPRCESALVLGDGDGRLLEAFHKSQSDCDITSLDQSGRMLELQRERLQTEDSNLRRVEFVQQDARDYLPARGRHDVLVTAYFLDCFTEEQLANCLPKWIAGVKDRGYFYVVDFYQPRHGWHRYRSSVLLWLMHRFFRWQTELPNQRLVDLDAAFVAVRLEPLHEEILDGGLIRSRLFRVRHSTTLANGN